MSSSIGGIGEGGLVVRVDMFLLQLGQYCGAGVLPVPAPAAG